MTIPEYDRDVTRIGAPILCLAKSDGLGSRCSRYEGHEGPHMTFDGTGAWSAQWPAGWNDPLDGWEEWTWQKEQA